MIELSDAPRLETLVNEIGVRVSRFTGQPEGGPLLGARLLLLPAMAELADERLVRLGTAIEILRRATLVHRVPQSEEIWAGHGQTRFSRTLLGDMLFAESFRLLAEDGEPGTGTVLSRSMACVAEGELTGHGEDRDGSSAQRIRRAASFYEGAAATGAVVGKLTPPAAASYTEWGRAVGEAHERALAGGDGFSLCAPPVAWTGVASFVTCSVGVPE